jgi:hypothetical protein
MKSRGDIAIKYEIQMKALFYFSFPVPVMYKNRLKLKLQTEFLRPIFMFQQKSK